jgi:hypothetical protein
MPHISKYTFYSIFNGEKLHEQQLGSGNRYMTFRNCLYFASPIYAEMQCLHGTTEYKIMLKHLMCEKIYDQMEMLKTAIEGVMENSVNVDDAIENEKFAENITDAFSAKYGGYWNCNLYHIDDDYDFTSFKNFTNVIHLEVEQCRIIIYCD